PSRCCTPRWWRSYLPIAVTTRCHGQHNAGKARGRRSAGAEAPRMSDLVELVQRLGRPRALVVGDVMLDRYVWGDAERISQEAPVVLLRADPREERLGGAGSVATMLQALGAETRLVGVGGRDTGGVEVRPRRGNR